MADKATAMNIDGSAESPASETSGPLESFLMPADTPSNVAPMSRKRKRKADAGMGPIDLPALIHMLITVEQARRDYLNELTSRKHAQGPVGDQSERWLHHHAKRNTAAEIKFENVLVALKELVMLRAVIDSGITQLSELKSLFSRSGSKRSGLDPDCPHELDYDATQCLAILNLMFPLESLNAGVLGPTGSSKLGRRYAFPLQHVPNPRAQLHQLLCEVEVWTSTEAGQNANGADHTPSNCPGWLESARGFAWGQLRRSCLTYLRDTQNKIATQHQAMNPWVPAVPKADVSREDDAEMSPSMDDLDNIECISLSNDSGAGQDIAGPPAAQENDAILLAVSAQCSRGATVVERIVRHSRLVGSRFSQQAFYNGLL
ncbi:hypothetical protein GGI20_001376 [Coemansia sp. BCRC 34301]|nr:hypothetical protein GGI20_001376 [Coemansia sp. BCRC 34301]